MQSVRGTLLPFAVVALLALPVLYGCTKFQEHDTLTSLIKDRPTTSPTAQPAQTAPELPSVPAPSPTQLPTGIVSPKPDQESRTVPREVGPVKLPPYIVEAPDVLQIQAVVKDPTTGKEEQLPVQPVSGTFLVRPDGAVSLGLWGSVSVAGRTVEEAAQRVREHLTKARGADSNTGELRVTIDVHAHNSKRYYVIVNGNEENEQVYAFPLIGTETVVDAVANTPGLAEIANKLSVRVVRKAPLGKSEILPVDWFAIHRSGVTKTNYPLQPDDRIYLTSEGK